MFCFLLRLDYFYLITGISNITSDQESVFTVSNLVRKIKFESGSVLRPTPARAQVPNDCLDGTLSVCALSNVSKKSSSKTNFVVLSSKTKSAGKNKFAVEWYTCNKKDELSLIKVKILNREVDYSGVDSRGARAPPEFEGSEKGRSLISAYQSLAITTNTPVFKKLSAALSLWQ